MITPRPAPARRPRQLLHNGLAPQHTHAPAAPAPAARGEALPTRPDACVPSMFATAAFDYLFRPSAAETRKRSSSREKDTPARAPGAPLARLRIADCEGSRTVNVADIVWLEVAGSYVLVHTAECAHLILRTLASLLTDLGPGFVRVHRSAAIALSHVLQLRPRGKGAAVVELRGGGRVDCSRQHRGELIEQLGSGCLA